MVFPNRGNQCSTSPWALGNAAAIALRVVEHDAVCQRVQPEPAAEIGRQLDGFAVHRRKIGTVVQSVLANFKGQVRPVAGPAAVQACTSHGSV